MFQPPNAKGDEVASDSVVTVSAHHRWLHLLFGLRGGAGSYKNISKARGEVPNPVKIGSFAVLVNPELGLEAFGFGISYDLNLLWPPYTHYIDHDDYVHEEEMLKQEIKTYYTFRSSKFHLIPELGYVFLREGAWVYDVNSEKPDLYGKEYDDNNYCYGLSVRTKIKPVSKGYLWLYTRYVHDNLNIKVDNYRLDLQLGDEDYEIIPDNPVTSVFMNLGVSWCKKTDGRSEWFISLELKGTFGLL